MSWCVACAVEDGGRVRLADIAAGAALEAAVRDVRVVPAQRDSREVRARLARQCARVRHVRQRTRHSTARRR